MRSGVSRLLRVDSVISPRERIWPHLKVQNLARSSLPAFHMEGGTRADRGPEAASLPATVGVVDASVHPFRVEAVGIRHAHHHPLAVLEGEQRFRLVARVDGCVGAEPES